MAPLIGTERMEDVAEWYRLIVEVNLEAEGKTAEELFADIVAFEREYFAGVVALEGEYEAGQRRKGARMLDKEQVAAILERCLTVTDDWGGQKLAGWTWGDHVLVAGIDEATEQIVKGMQGADDDG